MMHGDGNIRYQNKDFYIGIFFNKKVNFIKIWKTDKVVSK
jgi:hypothetical protein